MPVVLRYKSFRFFFYSNEGNPREAMHVRVRGADGEAKFWLTPTVYLADSDGLDARTLRDLRNAVMPHPWHGFRDCLKQALSSSHWWS